MNAFLIAREFDIHPVEPAAESSGYLMLTASIY